MFLLIVGLLVLMLDTHLFGQSTPSIQDWTKCVASLRLPISPSIPFGGVRSGTVTANIRFASDGKATIAISGTPDIARLELRAYLNLSRFNGEKCAGNTITLKFTYIVAGQEVMETEIPFSRFEPPNTFIFIYRPRHPIIEPAAPPP